MSSTNRGGRRSPADYYPTPAWCVWRLLEACDLPGGRWLEPCAGDGAIVRAVSQHRDDVRWTAVELRDGCRSELEALPAVDRVRIGDVRQLRLTGTWDVVVTNPPFSIAQDILEHVRGLGGTTVMLLRLNFLASGRRAPFMRAHPPDVYVLPNRPSFTGRGTDSIEYAWFVWPETPGRSSGRVQVLPPTPKARRTR